ncbi:vacuolar membrane-associated protein Iml1, partial [Syncephalis pseudoplumigaleata]
LTFRDQYLGRNDMWRLRQSLLGKTVYISQRVLFAGCIRAQVGDIYIGGRPAASALIGEGTRVIFRSESAKFFILIQMSREMWEFDDDGQLFYEKVTHQFLPELFARWKAISANHVVCIVLFTRVFYDFMEPDFTACPADDEQSPRWYKDYYKVLADWETRSDWSQVLPVLKREQVEFKRAVLTRETSPYAAATGTISMARHGNVLEAISLALNTFDRHYVDRDLLRTGQAIMVLTPGAGYFEVDKKLLRLTAERMFDSGIALDLVCLDQIPLHAAPLFKF